MTDLAIKAALLRDHALLLALAKRGVVSIDEYFEEFKKLYSMFVKPGETQEELEAQLELLLSEAEITNGLKELL